MQIPVCRGEQINHQRAGRIDAEPMNLLGDSQIIGSVLHITEKIALRLLFGCSINFLNEIQGSALANKKTRFIGAAAFLGLDDKPEV